MKRSLLTILSISFLNFLTCCELLNGPDELPPITMEGKNTFGCLVNGKLWLPDGSMNIPKVLATYFSGPAQKNNLGFSAVNVTNGSGFAFYVSNPILINHSYSLTDTITYVYYTDGICRYEDYHALNGVVSISRFDLQNAIVSGTFEFTTYNPACGDTIKVTQGRFDFGITL